MGCDIHIIAEVRTDGVWRAVTEDIFNADGYEKERGRPFVAAPFEWRDYWMFSLFAGVRHRDVKPISEPRGIPADASPEALEVVDDDSLHSHSWLTVAELLAVDDDQRAAVTSDEYAAHLAVLEGLGPPDDVRIVFAFDS